MRIAQDYDFDPRILADAGTVEFAAELARSERIEWVERRLEFLTAQRLMPKRGRASVISDEDRAFYRLPDAPAS